MRNRFPAVLSTILLLGTLTTPSLAAPARLQYAGTYVTTRPGVDSTQQLVLVLAPNGRATLTTSFPDLVQRYGPGVFPVRETGTWHALGTSAEVRLTAIGLVPRRNRMKPEREDKRIVFGATGCRLTAIRYPKALYGEAGLTFDKSGCKG